MVQIARPASDITVGLWAPFPASPTTLFDKMNEVTPNGDTDYIYSSNDEDECEVSVGAVGDPEIGTGHKIRCYAKCPLGSGAKEQMWIALVENGNVRATSPVVNVDRNSYALIEYTLLEAEANAIGNYGNLRLRFHITKVNGGEPIQITQAELEVPDAAAEDQTLVPDGIASLESVGAPKANLKVSPNVVPGGEVFGTSKLNLRLLAQVTPSLESVGAPKANLKVFPDVVPSLEDFGTLIDNGIIDGLRNDFLQTNWTVFNLINPANASGIIDHIELWLQNNATSEPIKVGVFYGTGGSNYICRNVVTLSATGSAGEKLTFDAPGDFTAFSVEEGDYIGAYALNDAGQIQANGVSGTGVMYVNGDQTDGGEDSYSLGANDEMQLYATGVTTPKLVHVAPGDQTLIPGEIASLEGFGTSVLGLYLLSLAIASLEELGTPNVVKAIKPSVIGSLEGFGSPQLNLRLLIQALASGEGFGTAFLNLQQTLLPGGIGSLEGFGTAFLNLQQTLLPGGIGSLEGFGTAFINALQTLLPGGIGSLEGFGTASVTLWVQIVEPSAIVSLESVGTAGVGFLVAPGGIGSLEGFGTAKLNYRIFPSSVLSGEGFGTAFLNTIQTLLPSGVISLEAFGTAFLNLQQTLILLGIASGEGFGTAVLKRFLSPTGIESQEVFGTAFLNMPQTLIPSEMVSLEAFGVSKLNLRLLMQGLSSQETFGTPQLDYRLIMSSVPSGEGFGTPTLGLYLIPPGITSQEGFGTSKLNYVILSDGVISEELFGDAKLNLELIPIAIPSSEVFGSARVELVIEQTIIVPGLVSGEVFGLPRVGIVYPVYFKIAPRGRILEVIPRGRMKKVEKRGRIIKVSERR